MALNFPTSPTVGDSFVSGGTTWQFDGVAWTVVDSSSPVQVTNNFNKISVEGQDDVLAESANDTLTFVAGTNITITTDSATDALTINSTASGGGGGPDQN